MGGLSACGGEPSQVVRFATEAPAEVFSLEGVTRRAEVFSWSFVDDRDLAKWEVHNVDGDLEVSGGRLTLSSSSDDPQIWRHTDFDTRMVDAIEVVLNGAAKGRPQIFWASEGEGFSSERGMFATQSRAAEQGFTAFIFPVSSSPHWSSSVATLRLDPTSVRGERIALRSVVGHSLLATDALSERTETVWQIKIGTTLRNGFVSPAGRVREWTLDLPERASLKWDHARYVGVTTGRAVGPELTIGDPVVKVWARRGDGPQELLFRRTLGRSPTGQASDWVAQEVDLSTYGGEIATITMETDSTLPDGLTRGLAAWGNPRVVPDSLRKTRPNVILISLDTLRADHLSLNGYSRKTSPNIDAWADRSGVNFQSAVASAPWTLPSHVSIFSGQDALTHGVDHLGQMERPKMLAEILRSEGYVTAALTGGGFLHPRYRFTKGFDEYYYPPTGRGESEAEEIFSRARAWLSSQEGRPFFLFLHTYEVHAPYRRREPYFSSFNDSAPPGLAGVRIEPVPAQARQGQLSALHRWVTLGEEAAGYFAGDDAQRLTTDLYDSGIAFADDQVGKLFRTMRELDLEDKTVVILTSDHGEALGEHSQRGHGHVYDHDILVPLIIAYPSELPRGKVITEQVRSIDILPTLLELLDVESPWGVEGVSLLSLVGGGQRTPPGAAWTYAANTNYGISLRYKNRIKYIFYNTSWWPLHGRQELYDLSVDPEESQNLANRQPTDRSRLEARQQLSRVPGLLIRMSNSSESSVRGEIRNAALSLYTLKSSNLPCACVSPSSSSSQAVSFSVPPGVNYDLLIEDIGNEKVSITASLAEGGGNGETTLEFEIRPEEFSHGVGVSWDGGRWHSVGLGGQQPETGILAIWQGRSANWSPKTVVEDAALRQNLRALGYVQ